MYTILPKPSSNIILIVTALYNLVDTAGCKASPVFQQSADTLHVKSNQTKPTPPGVIPRPESFQPKATTSPKYAALSKPSSRILHSTQTVLPSPNPSQDARLVWKPYFKKMVHPSQA